MTYILVFCILKTNKLTPFLLFFSKSARFDSINIEKDNQLLLLLNAVFQGDQSSKMFTTFWRIVICKEICNISENLMTLENGVQQQQQFVVFFYINRVKTVLTWKKNIRKGVNLFVFKMEKQGHTSQFRE